MTQKMIHSALTAICLLASPLAFAEQAPEFAKDRISSFQRIINYSSDLECAKSYETGWSKCMMRQPSRRAIRTQVNLRVESLASSPKEVCMSVFNQTRSQITGDLAKLGQPTDSISASLIDFSFKGSMNQPTQIQCTFQFVSHKKELRFQAHYLNKSIYSSESKQPEICDSTLSQFKKIYPDAIAPQAVVVDPFTDAGPPYCLATGFSIGLDQVVGGELVKFGSIK